MCTAGVDHYRSLGSDTAKHCGDQQSGLFHYPSLGETLLGRSCYTLGFATHI